MFYQRVVRPVFFGSHPHIASQKQGASALGKNKYGHAIVAN